MTEAGTLPRSKVLSPSAGGSAYTRASSSSRRRFGGVIVTRVRAGGFGVTSGLTVPVGSSGRSIGASGAGGSGEAVLGNGRLPVEDRNPEVLPWLAPSP